ncbi:meiosis-specific coiled-coil domain-containing protein MEIOC-like isoform X2 [Hemicordylus capensis]|uniref:meiosis-specific coiled-coil domain-containing protein MEIOC-like isoform X2 n=1 Tax=Hemicordylus capensis TaxID=884348 RepID=UPI0023033471|nr:meiosis-specific coiled-coil domain-containing protein MEIOC-like isoform X2 [Hemicordylus capensis]
MVTDGARPLAVLLAAGAARPEVKLVALGSFGNATCPENTRLHTENENMVKESATLGHHNPQVSSTKQEMDTQFSQFFGGITNTPLLMESPQLYSSWSTCEDSANAVASLQVSTKNRTQVNLSYSGSGPDMFGLVRSILEEPNKQEPVTDWNSLATIFPPAWSSDFENSSSFSGLLPKENLENKDLTHLVSTQNPYEENVQKFSSVELLEKELDDLHVIGSSLSPTDPCTQSPSDILKNANPENKTLKMNGINQQSNFVYQDVHDYDKELINDSGKSHAEFSTFSTQTRIKDSTNTYTEYPKADKARGMLKRNDTEGPRKYFTQLSSIPADGIWDPVTQENNLSSQKCMSSTAACDSRQFCCPPFFLSPILNKENNFPEGLNMKLQETYPHNLLNSFSSERSFGNTECKVSVHPQKGSYNNLPLKPALENMNSSYNGYTWLDSKIQNPVAPPNATYGKQKQISPRFSSGSSTPSNGSSMDHLVTQPLYSQIPLSSSRKDRKLQMPIAPNSSGFSNFTENRKQHNHTVHSQNDSVATREGHYNKVSINGSSSWLLQKHSVNESAKCHRFHNKQNRYNTHERIVPHERRHKNNWIPHPGFTGPNGAQFDALRRKREQNGGSLSDFINPSFLPLLPLPSGYKHMQNFPPFNLHPFSPPANVTFSPLPFPLSELVDLFHCDDVHHLNPFINDLFCGEIPAPYFAFPSPLSNSRPPKYRTGPANELHIHLEECYEQWRALERERKKAEADVARNFPGKQVSSSNNVPLTRLPAKPSRVDRLIVDQFQEQVHTLIGKMEMFCGIPVHCNISATLRHHIESICATQARRKDEIVNAVNSRRQGTSRYNNEKDVLALAAAIKDLAMSTRKTRTALWCALQMILPKTSAGVLVKKEDVEKALQELCPVEHEDKENERESAMENPNRSSNEHTH